MRIGWGEVKVRSGGRSVVQGLCACRRRITWLCTCCIIAPAPPRRPSLPQKKKSEKKERRGGSRRVWGRFLRLAAVMYETSALRLISGGAFKEH